jgi:hypothetical protein
MNVFFQSMFRVLRFTRGPLALGMPRMQPRVFSTALTGDATAPFPLPQLIAMLQAKESELKELRLATDAERAAKDAELKAERAAKDALGAAFSDLKMVALLDAIKLAKALYDVDTARRIIGVRASLEVCIWDLWEKYAAGNKTRGATDRLRMLANGLCPPLVEYVRESALANDIDPRKALEELPLLYRALSAPLHQAGFVSDAETPIDAILNGDKTTLLLTSCLYKMTRRELRLYRMHMGERDVVKLILSEPRLSPLV